MDDQKKSDDLKLAEAKAWADMVMKSHSDKQSGQRNLHAEVRTLLIAHHQMVERSNEMLLIVHDRLKSIGDGMNDLLARIESVEECGVKYCGVYQRAVEYVRGNIVTEDGSAWNCVADKTKQAPGKGSDWQLRVKKGRDAR